MPQQFPNRPRPTTRRAPVAKATGPLMPVFDDQGILIGLADPKNVHPIAHTRAAPQGDMDIHGDRAPAPAPTPEELAKAVAGASFARGYNPDAVIKGAGQATDPFDRLLEALDPTHAAKVKNAVAAIALQLAGRRPIGTARAVTVAKAAAVQAASNELRRQTVTPGDVHAELARRIARGGRR